MLGPLVEILAYLVQVASGNLVLVLVFVLLPGLQLRPHKVYSLRVAHHIPHTIAGQQKESVEKQSVSCCIYAQSREAEILYQGRSRDLYRQIDLYYP